MAAVSSLRANPASRSIYKRPMITPLPLLLACGLVLTVVGMTAFARLTGIGVLRMPATAIVEYRDLAFRDLVERGIEVINPATGLVAERIALADGGGFIQTVMRGMMVDRKRAGATGEQPYRLARHEDGRMFLHDPSTGRVQTLDAFGSFHTNVFQSMLARGMTRCSGTC